MVITTVHPPSSVPDVPASLATALWQSPCINSVELFFSGYPLLRLFHGETNGNPPMWEENACGMIAMRANYY